MKTDRKKAASSQEETRRRNSVAAIRAFLNEPSVWTPEDVTELNRIIQEARLLRKPTFRMHETAATIASFRSKS